MVFEEGGLCVQVHSSHVNSSGDAKAKENRFPGSPAVPVLGYVSGSPLVPRARPEAFERVSAFGPELL